MTLLFIHATNSTFHACDQGNEYVRSADALEAGVRSGLAMLADEIDPDMLNAAIEISIRQEDGTPVLRSVVSVSVSPLLVVVSNAAGESLRGVPAEPA